MLNVAYMNAWIAMLMGRESCVYLFRTNFAMNGTERQKTSVTITAVVDRRRALVFREFTFRGVLLDYSR